MRLRLVEAAHDAEGDPLIPALHEAWNDRVQWPCTWSQRIRLIRLQRKTLGAVVQHEARALCHQTAAKRAGIALDQGYLVALAVHHRQIGRITCKPRKLLIQIRGQHMALRAISNLRSPLRRKLL